MTFYSSNWHNKATPLITQNLEACLEGNVTAVTKLVECPVDESVPALAEVRYNGHSYILSSTVDFVFSSESMFVEVYKTTECQTK